MCFCIGKDKLEDFKKIKEYKITFYEERTVYKGRIWDERFQRLYGLVVKGREKNPSFILNLPIPLLKSFRWLLEWGWLL